MASKKPEMYWRDGFEAQPRWALMEMKELDPRKNERRNV
jgi:hypothetical protein